MSSNDFEEGLQLLLSLFNEVVAQIAKVFLLRKRRNYQTFVVFAFLQLSQQPFKVAESPPDRIGLVVNIAGEFAL